MAETLARRGALTVLPQDVAPSAVAEIVAWIKSRHLVWDTPLVLAHRRRRGRGAEPAAQARARHGRRGRRRRAPGRHRRRGGVHGRRPLHPARRRARPGAAHAAARHRAARGVRGARRRAASRSGSTPTGRLAGLLTALGAAARRDLHPGASTPRAGCAPRPRSAINGDVAVKAKALLDAGRGRAGRRHRARPPGEDARRAARPSARRGAGGRTCRWSAGNVVTAGGRARPRRGGRGHRQGRRRARARCAPRG